MLPVDGDDDIGCGGTYGNGYDDVIANDAIVYDVIANVIIYGRWGGGCVRRLLLRSGWNGSSVIGFFRVCRALRFSPSEGSVGRIECRHGTIVSTTGILVGILVAPHPILVIAKG